MTNDPHSTSASVDTLIAAARPDGLTIPARMIEPRDQVDRALDKLRTAQLALSPENKGWLDDTSLLSVWATLHEAISDLEIVRADMHAAGGRA